LVEVTAAHRLELVRGRRPQKASIVTAVVPGLARVRTARDGNAPSILGYLARVAALARFSFESVGPIQSLLAWQRIRWVERSMG
jgi:hypothetical protein